MRPLSPLDCAAYAELSDLCRIDAARPAGRYKVNGSFVEEARNGGKDRYWYYRGYERTLDGTAGTATKTYVGPAGNPAIEAMVATHEQANASYRARSQLVSRLKRVGLPAPHPIEGAVVRLLADTGLLASGAAIVGSTAFQTYGGLLGVRFEQSQCRTLDLDVAQPRGFTIHSSREGATDLLEVLRTADPTFTHYFHTSEPRLVAGYRNATGFRIEFLVPLASRRSSSTGFVELAGFVGVGAQQLRFLEFSLKGTIDSIMLYEAGLIVPVPDPTRFAVHKLIVAASRSLRASEGGAKSAKDILQVQSIIEGVLHQRDPTSLGRTWLEAWETGPKWRLALRRGTLRLTDRHLAILATAVTEAAIMDGVLSPFENSADWRAALATDGSS